jgi:hypothetical protein
LVDDAKGLQLSESDIEETKAHEYIFKERKNRATNKIRNSKDCIKEKTIEKAILICFSMVLATIKLLNLQVSRPRLLFLTNTRQFSLNCAMINSAISQLASLYPVPSVGFSSLAMSVTAVLGVSA